MILEEETFEAYGYYPSELKLQSAKPIIAACELCGEFKITSKNGYRTFCKSCSHKGNKSILWKGGRTKRNCLTCNKEFYVKPSRVKIGKGKYCCRSCAAKAQHGKTAAHWKGGSKKRICKTCGKEFEVNRARIKNGKGNFCSILCSVKAQRHNAKPEMTAPEKAFEAICIKNNLPFKFIGNGTRWLGNANPDFMHNTKKIVVEVFGDYFHSPLLNYNLRNTATVEGRTAQLKSEGYKCIVIWESDVMREDAEAFVIRSLKNEKGI